MKSRKGFINAVKYRISKIIAFLMSNQFVLIFTITFAILFLGALIFFLMERGKNTGINTYFDAVWWIIVTMSTVGYGDISPSTTGGRVVAILIMFTGVAFMGLLSATIASWIIERDLKGGMGMLDIDLEGHVVVCGWNPQARQLVENILPELQEEGRELVILANLSQKPLEDKRVYFVKGDSTNETDLRRTNITKAKTALILTDATIGGSETADARTILTTLAIETMNPEIYTCAEVLDSKNISHLRNANVDEIIPTGEFSGRLMAKTAMSHGISMAVSELLTLNEGSDLFKVRVPKDLAGKTFNEFFIHLRGKKEPIIPIAIERKKEVTVNPKDDFKIEQGDNVILICRKKLEQEDLL